MALIQRVLDTYHPGAVHGEGLEVKEAASPEVLLIPHPDGRWSTQNFHESSNLLVVLHLFLFPNHVLV